MNPAELRAHIENQAQEARDCLATARKEPGLSADAKATLSAAEVQGRAMFASAQVQVEIVAALHGIETAIHDS